MKKTLLLLTTMALSGCVSDYETRTATGNALRGFGAGYNAARHPQVYPRTVCVPRGTQAPHCWLAY